MPTAVEMPQLGNTVEECIVARWVKRKGDVVSAGDVVAEIETDKTTFEVTAPVDGTVLETFFDQGALVPVFTRIFVIGQPGESVDAFRPGRAAQRSAAVETAPAYSPRARRFADRHDFRPSSVKGSGPGGRILEKDLQREYDRSSRPEGARRAPSGLRAAIARRMRESLASTAQYTLNASADASGLLAVRARIKGARGLPGITINDLVTFCTIQALVAMPDVNAEFVDGRIVTHSEVHLAFAVDTPKGLLAPVVRDAHRLGIGELAAQLKDLSAEAVRGTIPADKLSGGTFTISNLGSLGIESFTPLVNPPQVAILGVGSIQLRPVRRHGAVEFVESIGLSLTCDHQVIDGAPGARFLSVVREKIEGVEFIGLTTPVVRGS